MHTHKADSVAIALPRIAAARLHCCVSAALRGLAVGATRLRLADAGGAGAGKCLRGSAQHA